MPNESPRLVVLTQDPKKYLVYYPAQQLAVHTINNKNNMQKNETVDNILFHYLLQASLYCK